MGNLILFLFVLLISISMVLILLRRNHILALKTNEESRANKENLADEISASIAQSEEPFRSIMDSMMEGGQIIGFDWRYIYINDAAEKQNRCPKEKLLNNIYMEMWPGVENTDVFASMKTCMEERIPQKIENEFVFPDGTNGWYDIRIQPIYEGIFILSTDVTRHVQWVKNTKLANEVLRYLNNKSETEEMVASIVECIKGSTGYDAVGIRLRQGNDLPYYMTTGYSDEFVKTERHLCNYTAEGKLIHNSNGEPMYDCMCGNILQGQTDPSQLFFTEGGSFRTNDSTNLLISESFKGYLTKTRNRCENFGYKSIGLIPLRSGEQIVGILQLNDQRENVFSPEVISFFEGLGANIGIALMRNKAENELRLLNEELENRIEHRTKKLIESNNELESFAYSVSHDLRAPLRHVIGFSEKLERHLVGNYDSEVSRLTGKITRAASRMSLLIDELLNYSRLGKTDLDLRKISPDKIIREIIAEAEDIISTRNILWEIEKMPEVKGDYTGIKLVFQNLINNAIKFSEDSDPAVINIGCEERNANEFLFYVKDNGVGFNMEYVDKLFGVFQRLHSSEEFEGTGIGLASVRRIVNRHGGLVWAKSQEGKGAAFYFTLLR
jgi:signal transduction histidine kinase/PAS domain-containing protein